jgi:hypothetical protein
MYYDAMYVHLYLYLRTATCRGIVNSAWFYRLPPDFPMCHSAKVSFDKFSRYPPVPNYLLVPLMLTIIKCIHSKLSCETSSIMLRRRARYPGYDARVNQAEQI